MISERLTLLRENKKLTKKQVSDDTGINYSTYANYESGAREPNSEMLIKISEYYNVTIDYIMGLSDNPKRRYGDPSNTEPVEEDLKFALFGGDTEIITDEMMDDVKRYAAFLAEQEKGKKKGE